MLTLQEAYAAIAAKVILSKKFRSAFDELMGETGKRNKSGEKLDKEPLKGVKSKKLSSEAEKSRSEEESTEEVEEPFGDEDEDEDDDEEEEEPYDTSVVRF